MKNLQMLEVSHIAATDTKGTRIKVYNHRHNESKIFGKNYSYSLHIDQILDLIADKDLIIGVSYSEKNKNYMIILDSKNNSFLNLKELFETN
ncbi:MAG: hypothetical protein QG567_2486 [Campylobacterota bacterium]|nr:hypothetical protein [Campylobacterota bacterium]